MLQTNQDKVARIRHIKDAGEARDLEALLEVTRALHATLDVKDLLALVVQKAVALTGADRGCLLTVDEAGRYRVEIACDRSGDHLRPESFHPSSSVLLAALRQKSALVVNDVANTEFGDKSSIQALSIRMVLCAPLFVNGHVAGLVYVDSVASREGFSERRLRTLEALAGQAAVAWQQASMFAEISELFQKTRILDAGKLDFIHIASHELRTPLALVRGYVDMLACLVGEGDYERVRELLGNISGGVARLSEVVDSMLLVTRIEQGDFSLARTPYPLRNLVEQVVADWQAAAAERDQRLKAVFDGIDDGRVVWEIDAVNLKMALGHLVQNAVKFTPDGGRIEVRLLAMPDAVQVEVADTGIGIEPSYQDVVFEKFYRIGDVGNHSSGKTRFMGAGPGLGLFLARGIVQAHGGRVWVESEGEGEGSCFIVFLPKGGRE
jgi:signal transduction histidine kinase